MRKGGKVGPDDLNSQGKNPGFSNPKVDVVKFFFYTISNLERLKSRVELLFNS